MLLASAVCVGLLVGASCSEAPNVEDPNAQPISAGEGTLELNLLSFYHDAVSSTPELQICRDEETDALAPCPEPGPGTPFEVCSFMQYFRDRSGGTFGIFQLRPRDRAAPYTCAEGFGDDHEALEVFTAANLYGEDIPFQFDAYRHPTLHGALALDGARYALAYVEPNAQGAYLVVRAMGLEHTEEARAQYDTSYQRRFSDLSAEVDDIATALSSRCDAARERHRDDVNYYVQAQAVLCEARQE